MDYTYADVIIISVFIFIAIDLLVVLWFYFYVLKLQFISHVKKTIDFFKIDLDFGRAVQTYYSKSKVKLIWACIHFITLSGCSLVLFAFSFTLLNEHIITTILIWLFLNIEFILSFVLLFYFFKKWNIKLYYNSELFKTVYPETSFQKLNFVYKHNNRESLRSRLINRNLRLFLKELELNKIDKDYLLMKYLVKCFMLTDIFLHSSEAYQTTVFSNGLPVTDLSNVGKLVVDNVMAIYQSKKITI